MKEIPRGDIFKPSIGLKKSNDSFAYLAVWRE